jgi:hypothetical protein
MAGTEGKNDYRAYVRCYRLLHARRIDEVSSLIVMPIPACMNYGTGKALGMEPLFAGLKDTAVCPFHSFVLLIGPAVRNVFWSGFADPVVWFLIIPFLLKDGFEPVFERNGNDE